MRATSCCPRPWPSGPMTPPPPCPSVWPWSGPACGRAPWGPSIAVDAHIRGLSPFPGAWFLAPGPDGPVRVKVLMSAPVTGQGTPGTVLDDGLTVACADGAVRLLRVQREGRAAQAPDEFLRGFALPAGSVLSPSDSER